MSLSVSASIDQQTKVIHDKKKELEALIGVGYEAIFEKQKLMKEIAECEALSFKNQEESRIVINEYDRVLSEVRDAQRMTSNLINVDGVDFMDEKE